MDLTSQTSCAGMGVPAFETESGRLCLKFETDWLQRVIRSLREHTFIGQDTLEQNKAYSMGESVNIIVDSYHMKQQSEELVLVLTPLKGVREHNLTAKKNASFAMDTVGNYKLEVTYGGHSEPVFDHFSLQCSSDHQQVGTGCQKVENCEAPKKQIDGRCLLRSAGRLLDPPVVKNAV